MARKSLICSVTLLSALIVLFAGCGPQASDMSLKFSEPVTTYKSVTEVIQDYKFEQPSIDKVKEEQNKSVFTITFDQAIKTVKEDGSADAVITIKAISVYMKDRDGVKMDFDSSREKDKTQPLNKMIGQSYTINISPDGNATVIDTSDIKKAVHGGLSASVADKILSDEQIIKRHSIALPEKDTAMLSKGATFSKIAPAPPRTLDPKSFEKTYTLDSIDTSGIATVKMSALPSDKPVEGLDPQGSFGFMAKMFDTKETWQGQMTFDTNTGQAISTSEKFRADYIATDTKNTTGKADTLNMGLTYAVSLEKL